jgi:hypothetical protein
MAITQGIMPRYEQAVIYSSTGVGTGLLTSEVYRDTVFVMNFFRHDQDDSLSLSVQMPTRKKLSYPLTEIHIHCIPMVTPSSSPQNVYFQIDYSWQNIGLAFPLAASWVSANVTMPVATGDEFKTKEFVLASNIPAPTGETYDSLFLIRVARLGTSGSDTYNTNKAGGTAQANLGLVSVDFIFLKDRLGSINVETD